MMIAPTRRPIDSPTKRAPDFAGGAAAGDVNLRRMRPAAGRTNKQTSCPGTSARDQVHTVSPQLLTRRSACASTGLLLASFPGELGRSRDAPLIPPRPSFPARVAATASAPTAPSAPSTPSKPLTPSAPLLPRVANYPRTNRPGPSSNYPCLPCPPRASRDRSLSLPDRAHEPCDPSNLGRRAGKANPRACTVLWPLLASRRTFRSTLTHLAGGASLNPPPQLPPALAHLTHRGQHGVR